MNTTTIMHLMCRYLCFIIYVILLNEYTFALTSSSIESFENYLKKCYLIERRNYEKVFFDEKSLNQRQIIAIEDQQNALKMLLDRRKGIVSKIGGRDLATIAAACGKYKWMRECIIDGDSAIPKSGYFSSPFTSVASGVGDVILQNNIQDRIKEMEWIINRHKNVFSIVDQMTIYAAAQASGVYTKDEGAMFDYLIYKGLPISYDGLLILLTINNSSFVIKKYKLLEKISKKERAKCLDFIIKSNVEDKQKKIDLFLMYNDQSER